MTASFADLRSDTLTKPTPEPPPPPGSVAYLLSTLDSIQDGQTVEDYTQHLAITGVTAQVNANAYRLKLGLELLAAAPKPREGRTEWEAQQAERLGVKPRQFRNILSAARSVRLLATEMPIAVLDRPLTKLPAATKAIKNGQDPDAPVGMGEKRPKPVSDIVDATVKKLAVAIAGVPVSERLVLIERVTLAMSVLGEKIAVG